MGAGGIAVVGGGAILVYVEPVAAGLEPVDLAEDLHPSVGLEQRQPDTRGNPVSVAGTISTKAFFTLCEDDEEDDICTVFCGSEILISFKGVAKAAPRPNRIAMLIMLFILCTLLGKFRLMLGRAGQVLLYRTGKHLFLGNPSTRFALYPFIYRTSFFVPNTIEYKELNEPTFGFP